MEAIEVESVDSEALSLIFTFSTLSGAAEALLEAADLWEGARGRGDGDARVRDGLLTAGAHDSEGGGEEETSTTASPGGGGACRGSGGESGVGEVELAKAALSPRSIGIR